MDDDLYILNFIKAKEDFEKRFGIFDIDLTITRHRFKLFNTDLSHHIVLIDGREDVTYRISSLEKIKNSNYWIAKIHSSESDLYGKKYMLDYRLKVANG